MIWAGVPWVVPWGWKIILSTKWSLLTIWSKGVCIGFCILTLIWLFLFSNNKLFLLSIKRLFLMAKLSFICWWGWCWWWRGWWIKRGCCCCWDWMKCWCYCLGFWTCCNGIKHYFPKWGIGFIPGVKTNDWKTGLSILTFMFMGGCEGDEPGRGSRWRWGGIGGWWGKGWGGWFMLMNMFRGIEAFISICWFGTLWGYMFMLIAIGGGPLFIMCCGFIIFGCWDATILLWCWESTNLGLSPFKGSGFWLTWWNSTLLLRCIISNGLCLSGICDCCWILSELAILLYGNFCVLL